MAYLHVKSRMNYQGLEKDFLSYGDFNGFDRYIHFS